MGWIGLIGTAVSALGQYKQGQDQARAAEYNAFIAKQKAKTTRAVGKIEAERIRKQGERLTSRQRALYAKSGVTFSGSPMEVMIDSATDMEMDAFLTEFNYETGALRSESQASIYERSADTYKQNSYIRAGSTLLQGASKSGAFDGFSGGRSSGNWTAPSGQVFNYR